MPEVKPDNCSRAGPRKGEAAMKSTRKENEAGVVLILVLGLLTLFGVVALSFTYYATEIQCLQNPTVESRDGRCVQIIGTNQR